MGKNRGGGQLSGAIVLGAVVRGAVVLESNICFAEENGLFNLVGLILLCHGSNVLFVDRLSLKIETHCEGPSMY